MTRLVPWAFCLWSTVFCISTFLFSFPPFFFYSFFFYPFFFFPKLFLDANIFKLQPCSLKISPFIPSLPSALCKVQLYFQSTETYR